MLSNHDEKDDGSCEKINRLTFVGLIQMDLWGHVIQSSEFSGQIAWTISTLNWTSKSKISNFENEMLVEKEIFRLEISMSDFWSMAVGQTLQELFEIESGSRFFETTRNGDEIKELTTGGEF